MNYPEDRTELLKYIRNATRRSGLPREEYEEIKRRKLTANATVRELVEDSLDLGTYIWKGDRLVSISKGRVSDSR